MVLRERINEIRELSPQGNDLAEEIARHPIKLGLKSAIPGYYIFKTLNVPEFRNRPSMIAFNLFGEAVKLGLYSYMGYQIYQGLKGGFS